MIYQGLPHAVGAATIEFRGIGEESVGTEARAVEFG